MIIKDSEIKLLGKCLEIINYTQKAKTSVCRGYLRCALAS